MVLQPAMAAGTASMSAEEGSTAVPPGTYSPTAPMGRLTRQHRTPGIVSTSTGAACGATHSSWRGVWLRCPGIGGL